MHRDHGTNIPAVATVGPAERDQRDPIRLGTRRPVRLAHALDVDHVGRPRGLRRMHLPHAHCRPPLFSPGETQIIQSVPRLSHGAGRPVFWNVRDHVLAERRGRTVLLDEYVRVSELVLRLWLHGEHVDEFSRRSAPARHAGDDEGGTAVRPPHAGTGVHRGGGRVRVRRRPGVAHAPTRTREDGANSGGRLRRRCVPTGRIRPREHPLLLAPLRAAHDRGAHRVHCVGVLRRAQARTAPPQRPESVPGAVLSPLGRRLCGDVAAHRDTHLRRGHAQLLGELHGRVVESPAGIRVRRRESHQTGREEGRAELLVLPVPRRTRRRVAQALDGGFHFQFFEINVKAAFFGGFFCSR